MSDDADDWSDFEGTCPDGFCRHLSCNCDCWRKCPKCGVRCPEHDDNEHPFEEPENPEKPEEPET